MATQTIHVPDIGGAENVDVIEVSVAVGDVVAAEDSLLVLESDKASMDVPSPLAGKIVKILVAEGAKISEGDAIAEIEVEGAGAVEVAADEKAPEPTPQKEEKQKQPAKAAAAESGSSLNVDVPDIGGAESVEVIEICVAPGDEVEEGDSIIVLESDKASMDIPAPAAGKIDSISIKEGDKVAQGDAILVMVTAGSAAQPQAAAPEQPAPQIEKPAPEVPAASNAGPVDVAVPDIGGAQSVDVIEVCVAVGDEVAEGDSIIVLESDKASMDIPSPYAGKVLSLSIKEGDKVSQGAAILQLQAEGEADVVSAPVPQKKALSPQGALAPSSGAALPKNSNERHPQEIQSQGSEVYAGPAVRKLARQLGVDLTKVSPSGPRGRMSKDDLHGYVKSAIKDASTATSANVAGGSGIPPVPAVDHSKFGEITLLKRSKIQKLTAANMSRNWLNVPHVTQFDDADITELENFRKGIKAEAEKAGAKLTPLPFILKACAAALRAEPKFNVAIDADGEHMVQKHYINIGVAVDTPNGLMVPVVKDVDKKGLYELARETVELAGKARDGKLLPKDMQGGCFTISSLGPIGGKGFTPIVNAPEVAILGVSKADMKPVWNGKEFEARLALPLCLSYDHRAINGADAGRFMTYLVHMLGDVRRLLV